MGKVNNIVTIGGGTGAPTIIKALIDSGFSQINAISASTDSGGKTGHMRSDERDRIIAVSDLLRNLLALIPPKQNHLSQVQSFIDLISFTDGRNRNLGYTLYYGLLEKYGDNFLAVQKHLESLLGINFAGTAIPVTLYPTNIRFLTSTGAEYTGEHELDRLSMSSNHVTKFWLDKKVKATPEAISAIKTASTIIYCPGSLYGSVLANFLPTGICEALSTTKAKKILITNLVSDRNQTHHFQPYDYYKVFFKYTKLKKPFDLIITPHLTRAEFETKYPEITHNYAHEHSFFLGWEEADFAPLTALGIKHIRADVFSVTEKLSRLRHDHDKLAKVFSTIL